MINEKLYNELILEKARLQQKLDAIQNLLNNYDSPKIEYKAKNEDKKTDIPVNFSDNTNAILFALRNIGGGTVKDVLDYIDNN